MTTAGIAVNTQAATDSTGTQADATTAATSHSGIITERDTTTQTGITTQPDGAAQPGITTQPDGVAQPDITTQPDDTFK